LIRGRTEEETRKRKKNPESPNYKALENSREISAYEVLPDKKKDLFKQKQLIIR